MSVQERLYFLAFPSNFRLIYDCLFDLMQFPLFPLSYIVHYIKFQTLIIVKFGMKFSLAMKLTI